MASAMQLSMSIARGGEAARVRRKECTMDILLWIVFGLVVGIVAKLIMPGRDPGGMIVTIVLGVVGAMLGGWIGRVLGLYREGEAAGFIMAVVGAVVLLGLYRLFMTSRSRL
jgi:uncharacterized membrane protein YeaQ/YmgE (transglycosylase-associated protein family)